MIPRILNTRPQQTKPMVMDRIPITSPATAMLFVSGALPVREACANGTGGGCGAVLGAGAGADGVEPATGGADSVGAGSGGVAGVKAGSGVGGATNSLVACCAPKMSR